MLPVRFLCCGVILMLVGIRAFAEGNPDVAALRKEITALRAQEKATVKAIQTQYDTLIKADRLSEEVLATERKALAKQESELLAVATTTADKDAIRARYETLRGVLKNGGKLDAQQINVLRAEKTAIVKVVNAAYKGKVQEIEAAIKTLEKAPKPKKK
jgi:uncharacterized protein involved in exopolysaccharide biosynthesis